MADCSSNGTSNENGSSASGSGEFFGDKYSNDTQQDGDIDEDGKEGTKSLKSGSDSWKQRKYGSRHRYSTGSSSSSHPFELHQLQQHHGHFRDMGSNFSNVSEKNSLSSSQPNMNRSSKAPSSQTELSPNVSLITSKDIKPSQRSENGDSQTLSWISGQDSPHSPHKPDLRRVQSYKSIESTRTSEADNKWNSAATPPLRSSSPTPHLIKPTASRKVGEEDMEVPWTERSSVPLLYSPMALPPAKSVHQKHESDQDDKQPRRRMATRSSRTNSGGQYY
ncbi:hypothetical protein CLU79DRAFT_730156 [Phycomyces nitens]|nr:hypothetical protein CLU79DRAFT_730156 [Phycomyces nitens]